MYPPFQEALRLAQRSEMHQKNNITIVHFIDSFVLLIIKLYEMTK